MNTKRPNGRPNAWMGLVIAVLAAGVLAALVSGCSSGSSAAPAKTEAQSQLQKVPVEAGGSYFDVSVAGLAAMLKSKDFPLINVHIPYEGELDGTDLFIPYNEIGANLGKLPAGKDAKIVLYCRSGSMSAIAARELVKRGYTNVYNLDGGMIAWKAAGYPLLDKQR